MNTKAYFSDIKRVIERELNKGEKSILVAVAWLTDIELFEILCNKAKDGLNVELIIANDEINKNCSIQYEKLNQFGGYFSFDTYNSSNSLMHNKFCIIDLKTSLTGSYNWSYKARSNRENIAVTNDPRLAEQYGRYFYQLKSGNYIFKEDQTEKEETNLNFYLKRILSLIESNKLKEISTELFILKNLDYLNEDTYIIIIHLENKNWDNAKRAIIEYFKLKQQLTLFEDLELKTLSFHKESLENKLDKLIIEKNEIEKDIHQFKIIYNQRLGRILIELVDLKTKLNLKNTGAFEETRESINNALNSSIPEMDTLKQEKIKTIYKKAALMCHPDKVDDNLRSEAENVFKQLNSAYQNNDFDEVTRIHKDLKSNNFFARKRDYSDRSLMKNMIQQLIYKLKHIYYEINILKISPSYQVIENVHDWNLFYKLEEEKINNEIKTLKDEFSKETFFKKKAKK